jgi:hypothetical protein
MAMNEASGMSAAEAFGRHFIAAGIALLLFSIYVSLDDCFLASFLFGIGGAVALGVCRRCGAPMSKIPAELEVLRLSAETFAAMRGIVIGTICFLLSVLTFALLLAVKGAAGLAPAVVFAALWLFAAFPVILFSVRRLRVAVVNSSAPNALQAASVAPTITGQTAITNSNLSRENVTESTTQLLDAALEEQSVTAGNKQGTPFSFILRVLLSASGWRIFGASINGDSELR